MKSILTHSILNFQTSSKMNTIKNRRLIQDIVSTSLRLNTTNQVKFFASCPHAAVVGSDSESSHATHTSINEQRAAQPTTSFTEYADVAPRPYSEVPGPKPLPLLGNTWR